MKKESDTSADAADLRRRAEALLREEAAKGAPGQAEDDAQRLVHELQVHQIELEMQNEELRRSRAEVEAGLECYTELYDFAPIGYLTLGRDGAIRRSNLAGARLLGVERARHPWLADWEAVQGTLRENRPSPILRELHFDDKWYHQTLHFVAGGQRVRIYGADITARKKTPEAGPKSDKK